MSDTNTTVRSQPSALLRLRYRWSARQIFADLFKKPWLGPAVPFLTLVVIFWLAVVLIPTYLSAFNLDYISRLAASFLFVVMAISLSLSSGGIDLSVGSIFALCNFTALLCANVLQMDVYLIFPITLLVGFLLGAINGFFVGILRTRALLTTIVTLIIYRGVYNLLTSAYATDIASSQPDFDSAWDWLGNGTLGFIPPSVIVLVVFAIIAHVLLSRSPIGTHLFAVGASRRSARNAGINVERVLFLTYCSSGMLCAVAGTLNAAFLNDAGSSVGMGLELQTFAAAMVGGISFAGSSGSVGRALIGGGIIFLITNTLAQLGLSSGVAATINGLILLVAVGIDTKWSKHTQNAVQKSYINPTYLDYGPLPDTSPGAGNPFAMNDRLSGAQAIGRGQIEGPEDIILDREGRLYAVDRRGLVFRFSGANFEHQELFAKTGGRPLGMAFDRDDNLVVCVSGMGLYSVSPDGRVNKLTNKTNRGPTIIDDTMLKLTDDVDIGPDGKIYFSEGSTRFELQQWAVDGLEGRGTGRLICYDPATQKTRTLLRNLVFCNGICVTHDNTAVIFAETFAMRISRYWLSGPKKGQKEILLANLPGGVDNINRASDGGYWIALVAMRTTAYDIAMQEPGFRIRMIKRLPQDEWLIPCMNNGCVVKLDAEFRPQESYWDPSGLAHPTVTSMREDRGYLYLGGLDNDRIGRIRLEGANPDWVSSESYWGKRNAH
ncbi:ABC transporter permease [Castellaniella sp.]|uniref:ABC transporter permease n=1 Tax=Castellaniella sp. TaxID=1955812 RepID=UPI003567DE41